MVLVKTSEGINTAARDHASRQEILRVFVKFVKEYQTVLNLVPSKHAGVICDGCNRSPIIGILHDRCESSADLVRITFVFSLTNMIIQGSTNRRIGGWIDRTYICATSKKRRTFILSQNVRVGYLLRNKQISSQRKTRCTPVVFPHVFLEQ